MIKNDTDFDYAINQIVTKNNPIMIKQQQVLDSATFNLTLTEVEKTLNALYEKTRYLEDSILYARTFLDTKVREFNNEMSSTIKELESLLDMTKNLSYISYNVPLKSNAVTIKDRDNSYTNLNPLIVKDNALTLGYKSYKDYKISSADRLCDSISYDDNLDNISNEKSYRAIYLEEKPLKEGIVETITFHFPRPVTINILDFKPVNSQVRNLRFGLINGYEEKASDYSLALENVYRTCTYVKIDLVCSNYNTITYEVEKDQITNNIWNELKRYELSKIKPTMKKVNKLNTEHIISRTVADALTGKVQTENYSSSKGKNTVYLKLYSYVFGLNEFSFIDAVKYTEGYFISDYINIGQLTDIEYISLFVSHVKNENTCIEYSILDGEKEIPILPIDVEYVDNEPIFNNLETRFSRNIDSTSLNYQPEVIKKNGQVIDLSFEDVLGMSDGKYSISYQPEVIENWTTPINKEIRIKCYIRTYGSSLNNVPYIDLITIRKFGEETLWTNVY